jgi:heptaprenyl diphosphate synthase
MQTPASSLQATRSLVLLSLFVALAIALRGLEQLMPNPLPWVRVGLPNIMALLAILLFGIKAGLLLTILRVLIASFLFGTFLSPPFLLSLSAGIASSLVMGLSCRYGSRFFSPIGLSVLGGVTHNTTQLIVAFFLLIRQLQIFYLFPILAAIGVVTGCFNGWIAMLLYTRLRMQMPQFIPPEEEPHAQTEPDA